MTPRVVFDWVAGGRGSLELEWTVGGKSGKRERVSPVRPVEGEAMTITIELPKPVERRLTEEAARQGKTPAALVTEWVVRNLPEERTFDEILAPIRAEFEASGTTEEEWDAMIEQARDEVWRERQGRRS